MLLFSANSVWSANLAEHPATSVDTPATQANTSLHVPLNSNADFNLLLLELRLDNDSLAESLTAYELNNDILMPLGELSRLLTIDITVDPRTHMATGYVLKEGRTFQVDIANKTVNLSNDRQSLNPSQVHWIEDDIYVSTQLLQSWLPIDLQINLSSLSATVIPREKLPIQARLERERLAKSIGGQGASYHDPGYPHMPAEYDWISPPFIDQTIGVDVRKTESGKQWNGTHRAFLTTDLAGTEAFIYMTHSNNIKPDARITLARHDPDGELLGRLHARSIMVGNVTLPTLTNVLRGSNGNGLFFSSKPHSQSASYGLQTLRGNLLPGWDVTLYFNDALIGFQQSRSDGFYEFIDQTLIYGVNEFRLVFNGPLGQTRVENQVYIFDQTTTKPGEFFYTVANNHTGNGENRQTIQFDLGLTKNLALTGGLVRLPLSINGQEQSYSNLGLRTPTFGALLSADYVRANTGDSLYAMSIKTRIKRFSVDYTHTLLEDGFASDFYPQSSDSIKVRNQGRITGSIPITGAIWMPIALDVKREETQSGLKTYDIANRVSTNLLGTHFTNSVNWHFADNAKTATGQLQISRRLADITASGQMAYLIDPDSKISNYAITIDKRFGNTVRGSAGISHALEPNVITLTAGANWNFNRFGLGVSSSYASTGDVAVGMQLFMSMGRDPRTGKWMLDWQPMASYGAISTRTYMDDNMNGQFDTNEKLIAGAGYTINGGSRPARSNVQGLAYLSQIPPKQYADIAIDPNTLEDPQWVSEVRGVRILPRPGKVQMIDFPLVQTAEIDGTVYLQEGEGKPRGIGNARIELVDEKGAIVASTTSAADGYYILAAVRPGQYLARISTEQLIQLDLVSSEDKEVKISLDGQFVDGLNFTLRPK